MSITRIISGGQTGADQAGLFAAEDLAIATGGWMPKDGLTETGSNLALLARFRMTEHSSSSYTARTLANILAADGTFICAPRLSPGSRQTYALAVAQNRPIFVLSTERLHLGARQNDIAFATWLRVHDIKTLNVAGNRESVSPGIFDRLRDYLVCQLGVTPC